MRMLVATDLSEDGDAAIETARYLRARHGGSLVIAHVMPTSSRSEMLMTDEQEASGVAGVALQARIEDAIVARLPEDVLESERRIVEGSPGQALIELAEEEDCDMIVLGGRAPSGKRVFGSVAENILANSTLPVWIARAHKKTQRIVAATDLTEPGFPSVRRAIGIAALLDARITLVHCLPSGVEKIDPDAARILRKLRRDLPPTAETVVEQGEPAASVVAVAERLNADLIVVASRGRTGLARFVIGSVASAIVRKASCSVLVVPLPK